VADIKEFRLPDVGEGLTEAEIVSWKVKPGDRVKVNDVLVEIETAKSLVELPAPFAGVVADLLVAEGQTVAVGTPIVAVDVAPGPAAQEPASGEQQNESLLVGYGPRAGSSTRRARKQASAGPPAGAVHGLNQAFATAPMPTPPAPAAAEPPADQVASAQVTAAPAEAAPVAPPGDGPVLAKPPVRKLAKDLGVDLRSVTPSGAEGVVTREDVIAAAGRTVVEPAAREERIPIRSVRKATAQAMVTSAFTAPHVSEFLTVDVTRTIKLVNRLRESPEFRDVRLSPLGVVARAVCLAVRRTPEVNSSWDEAAQEIVLKRYVNLGIATATPRGLVVPNIKDADKLNLRELAVAINRLAEIAREGRTPPSDMSGGTLSITNIGVFGVDAGTPILPPGEAVIVAFGAVRQRPWVHKGRVRPRWVTTLGVSFDHRVVDGEQGSRFLADVGALLTDPDQALVWS
jgi:2-oxoisovalerate dehydrogenase E2 component (dihydrolipoyl transacylase)